MNKDTIVPANKKLLGELEKRLGQLSVDNILDFSKHDNGIYNVISNFHKESFSTIVWDDTKPDFDYFLIYVTKIKDTLEGFILRLQPHIKSRNQLTSCFASFISDKYKTKDHFTLFNTYQDQQRTVFERLGFWTYDDSLFDEFRGKRVSLMIKPGRGMFYLPFAPQGTDTKTINEKKKKNEIIKEKTLNKPDNFVYIMHNKHNNYYKIGRSNNPEFREKTLQSQEPDIVLIDKWLASAEIEKNLHYRYKDKKKRGEWFELTEVEINDIREFMALVVQRKQKYKVK